MKKKFLLAMIVALLSIASFGAKKPKTVLKIGEKSFTVDEFEFVFNKNNQLSQSPLSVNEYLDLFVNYKLKVVEATALGMDTMPSFLGEYNSYRDDLAKPYLTDKLADEAVETEAYERLKYEVDAAHILIKVDASGLPADTLVAYNKAMDIYNRATKGESFEELAVMFSEDPSAQSNNGRLGYFTGFDMVYPFETAAFSTPVGSVSKPARSSFGYHIIKVYDKRPASGEMNASHIMKAFPRDASEQLELQAKASIDSIYQLILKGESFEVLANMYSDDRNSAENGGDIGWFSFGRMIPDFANPAFQLKNDGDISAPIRTSFGWHIIKRLGKKDLESFEVMQPKIKERIASDQRAYAGHKAILKKLKADYQFKQTLSNLDTIKAISSAAEMTDSLFFVQTSKLVQPLFQFEKKVYNQNNFTNYLKSNQSYAVYHGPVILDQLYASYVDNQLIAFEKSALANKYPEYKYLLQECHDGLLIFDISQKMIWNKVSEDTVGIEKYYDLNQTKYPKPAYWTGSIYYLNSEETSSKVQRLLADGTTQLTDSVLKLNGIDVSWVRIEKGSFPQGKNSYVDATVFNDSTKSVVLPSGFTAHFAKGQLKPVGIYELSEIRGQVLSDYQTQVEANWVADLRKKYSPKVYPKTIKNIKPSK